MYNFFWKTPMPQSFIQTCGQAVRGTLPFLKNECGFVILKANCNDYESWLVKCNDFFVPLQLRKKSASFCGQQLTKGNGDKMLCNSYGTTK